MFYPCVTFGGFGTYFKASRGPCGVLTSRCFFDEFAAYPAGWAEAAKAEGIRSREGKNPVPGGSQLTTFLPQDTSTNQKSLTCKMTYKDYKPTDCKITYKPDLHAEA